MKMVLIAFALLMMTTLGFGVPLQINYQGFLTDAEGGLPLDSIVGITFSIYSAPVGGDAQWVEYHDTVTVRDGLFHVLLGSVSPLDDPVLFIADCWLGIRVGSDAEMSPRQPFASVAHAFRVATVDGASGGRISQKLNVGFNNSNGGASAFVAGRDNTASGHYSTITGGGWNTASGYMSVVGGGYVNAANDTAATITGGWDNDATDFGAFVGGGVVNQAAGRYSAVSGGMANSASGSSATVSGGLQNTAAGLGATIAGGENNFSNLDYSVVSGGRNNVANAGYATVSGGMFNAAQGGYATVSGGKYNIATGNFSTVGGGGSDTPDDMNSAQGDYSTVAGGVRNAATGVFAAVGGGYGNIASDSNATVAGGYFNTASLRRATVGGGRDNVANGGSSTIAGGSANLTDSSFSTVGGGARNQARNRFATVGGGENSISSGVYGTVGGGQWNQATAEAATVGGGILNQANGARSAVPGGLENTAGGAYSFAAGIRAIASHDNSFVWSGAGSNPLPAYTNSYAASTFTVRSPGGARFYTASSGTTVGVQISAGGGSWSSLCDARQKDFHGSVNTAEILRHIAVLPLQYWNYKSQDASLRHIGPTAQDFYAAFALGESDTTINTLDPDGVLLAAVQELAKQNELLRIELSELQNRLLAMERNER